MCKCTGNGVTIDRMKLAGDKMEFYYQNINFHGKSTLGLDGIAILVLDISYDRLQMSVG